MRLRDLIDASRGTDLRAFTERFGRAFLVEEGRLPHEPKRDVHFRSSTRKVLASSSTREEAGPMADRSVFALKRRDGKEGDVVVGRGPACDVRIDLESVSTRHALLIAAKGGRWRVRDAVSTNGTFVDGERLPVGHDAALGNAAVLRFGPEVRLAFYEAPQLFDLVKQVESTLGQKEVDQTPPYGTDTEIGMSAAAVHGSRVGVLGDRVPDYLKTEADVSDPSDPATIEAPAPNFEKSAKKATVPKPSQPKPTAGATKKSAPAPSAPPANQKVLLACEPFPAVVLESGKRVVIGRDKAVDLVLPNPQVSRKHAEAERRKDGVWVKDLGSQNGIFYLGKQVKEATVPFGGTFLVGPYTVEVQTPGWVPAAAALPDTIMVKPSAMSGLRGSLDEMPLSELLQGIAFNQKTGVIDVVTESEEVGFISFRGGVPHQARLAKLQGEEAVLALLAIKKGRFVLRSDEAAVGPKFLNASFTALLLEHGRRTDETGK